jgi:ammonium transporter, Amt family
MKHVVLKCCCIFAMLLPALPVLAHQSSSAPAAASSTTVNDKLAQLDQRVSAAQSSADNSWMLVSAALVLLMTGPGLALFYGGLVRRKNMLAIMMQSFMLMAVISVLWWATAWRLAETVRSSAGSSMRSCAASAPIQIPITPEPFRRQPS